MLFITETLFVKINDFVGFEYACNILVISRTKLSRCESSIAELYNASVRNCPNK